MSKPGVLIFGILQSPFLPLLFAGLRWPSLFMQRCVSSKS